MTLPAWPIYEPDEIEAAVAVLKSGKVNAWTGIDCRNFEEEFAKYTGVSHALALANGTLALEASKSLSHAGWLLSAGG